MSKQGFNNKVWVSGAVKSSESATISKPANLMLWAISLFVIVAGIFASNYFDALDSAYITSIAVITVLVALVIARFTNQGRRFWTFFNASKLEMAKVVWPTRRETMTITAMVIVVVMIFSVFIYLFGMLFGKVIQLFLG